MSVKSWFPTFVYYTNLYGKKSRKLNESLIDEAYRIKKLDVAGHAWCKKNYPGGYTSYGSIANLHQRSGTVIDLEKDIHKHVLKFAEKLDMDLAGKSVFMTDCWVNIMPHHVIHSWHVHPLSFISGTYYVKTPKGCSSIKFEDPRMPRLMAAPPKKKDAAPHNKQYVEYKAEAGNLVLFESWLPHEVESNPAKEDRISISFNYAWA